MYIKGEGEREREKEREKERERDRQEEREREGERGRGSGSERERQRPIVDRRRYVRARSQSERLRKGPASPSSKLLPDVPQAQTKL